MAEPTSTRPGIDPALKDLLDAFPLQIRVADGVEAARQKMRQIEPPADLLPTMRIEERTIGFDDLTDIPVRVYWPPIPAHDDLPVVVFYHGGGWAIGDLDTHDAVARAHAVGAEAIVVSVDYRLAPEHPFPAGIDDSWAALRWVGEHAAELGGDPARIAVAGDSAGGNLVLATLHRIKAVGEPMPSCAVVLSPVVDFTLSSRSIVVNAKRDPMFALSGLIALRGYYSPPERFLDPAVSPLFGDFRGFPPLLFQVGDIEVLLDESIRAAARAHAAGVQVELEIWDRMGHVFQAMASLPQAEAAAGNIAEFIARRNAWH